LSQISEENEDYSLDGFTDGGEGFGDVADKEYNAGEWAEMEEI